MQLSYAIRAAVVSSFPRVPSDAQRELLRDVIVQELS